MRHVDQHICVREAFALRSVSFNVVDRRVGFDEPGRLLDPGKDLKRTVSSCMNSSIADVVSLSLSDFGRVTVGF